MAALGEMPLCPGSRSASRRRAPDGDAAPAACASAAPGRGRAGRCRQRLPLPAPPSPHRHQAEFRCGPSPGEVPSAAEGGVRCWLFAPVPQGAPQESSLQRRGPQGKRLRFILRPNQTHGSRAVEPPGPGQPAGAGPRPRPSRHWPHVSANGGGAAGRAVNGAFFCEKLSSKSLPEVQETAHPRAAPFQRAGSWQHEMKSGVAAVQACQVGG